MKKKQTWIVVAICCSVVAAWLDTINNICLADIFAAFPQATSFMQSFITTGPALVALPITLLIGKLGNRLNTKMTLLITEGIFVLSALGQAFSESLALFVLCRTLAGVCNYVIVVLIYTVIFENFKDSVSAARVMGIYQGVNTVYGALIALVAGYLCLVSWRYTMLLNGIAIVSLLSAAFFLPKETTGEADSATEDTAATAGESRPLNRTGAIVTLIESTLLIMFTFVFMYYSGLYVEERGIGTSSLTGVLQSVMSIAGAVASFALGKVYEKCKRYGGLICACVVGVFFFMLGFDIPVWFVYICAFVAGIGCGLSVAYYPIVLNEYIPREQTTFYMSVINCLAFVAFYLCGILPAVYMALFGGGYQRVMLINGIVMLLFAAVFFCIIKMTSKKKVGKTP